MSRETSMAAPVRCSAWCGRLLSRPFCLGCLMRAASTSGVPSRGISPESPVASRIAWRHSRLRARWGYRHHVGRLRRFGNRALAIGGGALLHKRL